MAWPVDGSNVMQPMPPDGIFASHRCKIVVLQGFGDWTRPARANAPIVEFANRGDFRGCSREESLISAIDFIPRNPPLDNRYPPIARQFHHTIARNSFKDYRRLWRVQSSAFHDE
jgi:hypothetical protein